MAPIFRRIWWFSGNNGVVFNSVINYFFLMDTVHAMYVQECLRETRSIIKPYQLNFFWYVLLSPLHIPMFCYSFLLRKKINNCFMKKEKMICHGFMRKTSVKKNVKTISSIAHQCRLKCMCLSAREEGKNVFIIRKLRFRFCAIHTYTHNSTGTFSANSFCGAHTVRFKKNRFATSISAHTP